MITLVPKESLLGVIVGPVLWSVYFVLAYIASGLVCSLGFSEARLAGLNPVQWVLLVAGLIIGLMIVLAAAQAQRGRRRLRKTPVNDAEHEATLQRQNFLYSTSLLLCLFSLVGLIWLGMAATIAPYC